MTPGDLDPARNSVGLPLGYAMRELSLAWRQGEECSEVLERLVVKYPAHAGDLHRFARELDLGEDKTAIRDGSLHGDDTTAKAVGSDHHDDVTDATGESLALPEARPMSLSRDIDMPEVDLPEGTPERLGRFRLIKEIGRGGMGVVYLAHDEELQRLVAVKVLRGTGADDDSRERFRREQAALVKLDHPGIVPIYETGEEPGLQYFAMRYVDGMTLDRFVKSRSEETLAGDRSTVSEVGLVLGLIERLARALHHAHENGLLHRDVKPANVMIDREGNPLLLDFGLARQDVDQTITRSGSLPGTLPYMAPEALQGDELDHRADLYGLGVTLFEIVTGRRPFEGSQAEQLMFAIIRRQPPAPRRLRPDLARDIETVVLKCLEKEPHRRYASCAELADELERIQAHQRISAEPVGPLGRAWRLAARNRVAALLIAVVLLALLTAAGLGWRSGRLEEDRRAARAAEALAESDRARRDALSIAEDLSGIERRIESAGSAGESADVRAGLIRLQAEQRRLRRARRERLLDAEAALDRAAGLGAAIGTSLEALARELALAESALRDPRLPDAMRFGKLSFITEPAGAEVRARPYRRLEDGRLVPGDEPRTLGKTPLEAVGLPAGSWLLEIEAEGRMSLRAPILVREGEHWGDASFAEGRFADKDWTLRLPEAGSYDPEDWVRVPAGPYLASTPERQRGLAPGLAWRWLDGFLISKREIGFGPYLQLLQVPDLRRRIAADLDARGDSDFLPVTSLAGGKHELRLRLGANGRSFVATDSQPPLEELRELPACGLGFVAADNVAGYLGHVSGREISLPRAAEWEKAARGVDGRLYPWGDVFDWSFVAGRRSLAKPLGPGATTLASGSRVLDESPYGCLDMAGNAREWCLDGPTPQAHWLCGGALPDLDPLDFLAWPFRATASADRGDFYGIRLVIRDR